MHAADGPSGMPCRRAPTLLAWGQIAAILLAGASRAAALSLASAAVATPAGGQFGREAPAFRQVMENYRDMQYFTNLVVGGQHFKSVMDTGSLEFVVLSDKCPRWCGVSSPLFHSRLSLSYRRGPLNVVLAYGSGSVLAREAYENVTVGPYIEAVTPFWEVLDADMPLLFNSRFNAIVGFGPVPPNTTLLIPGLDNSRSYAVLPQKMGVGRFSVCLGREAGSHGFFTWDDDSLKTAPDLFSHIPVSSPEYWMTQLSDVRLGDVPVGCQSGGCNAILDSGTSLLALPREAYDAMLEAVDRLDVDCSNVIGLPELRFRLGDVDFSLPPDSYIGSVNGVADEHVARHFAVSNATCQAILMRAAVKDAASPTWILGMPFFRKYYSIFVQATEASPPAIHAALAGDDCLPAGLARRPALSRDRFAEARTRRARQFDASDILLPSWLRRASRPRTLSRAG